MTKHTTLLLLFLALAPAQADAAVTGQCYDAITTPGQRVKLRAKFERSYIGWTYRPDLEHKPVELSFAGQTAGAITDDDGVGEAWFQAPSQPGTYDFQARYGSTTLAGKLWVLDPQRPLAVIDIDGTISNLPAWLIAFRGAKAPSYPGAPELMRDLARTHQLVYLTARDDYWNPQTRPFLARHQFPAGPVIYNEKGSRDHAGYKLGRIQALQALGVTVALGIGNAETDGEAYRGAGIPSYLRNSHSGPDFRFMDYADLRTRLVADGFLSATGMTGALGTP